MRYIDGDIDNCIWNNKNRRVIFFGAGQNLRFAEASKLSAFREQTPYIIDNGKLVSVDLWGKQIPVFQPDKLKEENECSVIITTSKYITEMYHQLEELNLGDNVYLYIFPFMLLKENHPLTDEQKNQIFRSDGHQIPKIIHSFWFSGSKKPDEYQKCINTWKEFCPDYEIREWNLGNYDGSRHSFFRKAIEVKAWAYATDYARLDVVSRYGGIYMDMDVELVKPLDKLLSHNGVFPFCSDGVIELAMFMSKPDNPLVKSLFDIYDHLEIPDIKEGFNKFYQPFLIMEKLINFGVSMDNSFQHIDGNVFLPKQICMPLDYCLYELNSDEDTIAIHRANAGWHEADYTKRRVGANKELKNKLEILAYEN